MNGRRAKKLRRLANQKHLADGYDMTDRYVMIEKKRKPNRMAKLEAQRQAAVRAFLSDPAAVAEVFGDPKLRAKGGALDPQADLRLLASLFPEPSPTAGVLRVQGPRATYQRLKARYIALQRGTALP